MQLAESSLPILTLEATLLQGLAAIDAGGLETALIVEEGRLVGLLTDGDARRAILRGYQLESPVSSFMQTDYTAVDAQTGRAQVLDIMKARQFNLVPIVGAGGELLGIHTLHGLLGSAHRPTPAMILCGGLGTRLRPITETIPKPMITVAGRPILERIIIHLVGHGFQKIYLAIHYLGNMIEAHFGDGSTFGCQIHYIREERPLGTGGALALLPDNIQGPILVMNGDLITQFDAGGMVDQHVEQACTATMGVQAYVHQVPFGVVEEVGGRVVAMREKPSLQYRVNAGIYVLDSALRFRREPGEPATVPAILEDALGRGENVGIFAVDEDWTDVGHHEELKRARGQA